MKTILQGILIALGFCILLASCGSQPSKEGGEETQTVEVNPLEKAHELIAASQMAQDPERSSLLLSAAEILLQGNEIDRAEQTIENLIPAFLTDQQIAKLSLIKADIAMSHGELELARSLVIDEELEARFNNVSSDVILRLRELRAQFFFNEEDYSASVNERLSLSELFASEARSEEQEAKIIKNEQRLWQALMEIPVEHLRALTINYSSEQALGWYSLALLSKNNQTNLEQQLAAVNRWVAQWPEHPASVRLPADLHLLAEIAENQPQKIAVLLPLSGKLAKASSAIRDGLMAAFYERSESGQSLPEVSFFDTGNGEISSIYENAVGNGAQLIIGPLQKHHIAELALKLELPVPTLALNRVDSNVETAPGLFQFGLAVEDEIQQIAQQAWRDGHQRALVLAPIDQWGDRNIAAFGPAWTELGGELVHSYRYSGVNDYSNVIKKALHVDRSEQRSREIQNIVGRIGKEVRRREDIDMIFVAADVKQARQIKPTLAFYFASDIPVYSTGTVFSGVSNPKFDRDMNGIEFTTLPWFFEKNSTLKNKIQRYGSKSPAYQKLYALGTDAFHIYPRLRQLESVRQAQFYGFTGKLKLDEQRKIVREQVWGKYINGRARQQSKQQIINRQE